MKHRFGLCVQQTRKLDCSKETLQIYRNTVNPIFIASVLYLLCDVHVIDIVIPLHIYTELEVTNESG